MRAKLLRARTLKKQLLPAMATANGGPSNTPGPIAGKDTILRLSKVHGNLKLQRLTQDGGGWSGVVEDGRKTGPNSMLGQVWSSVSSCVFGCMLVLGRDVSVSNGSWYFLYGLSFLQLLCFPLSTNPRLLWTDTSISLLPRILGLLSLSGTQDGLVSDTAANVLFLVAVLWQLLVLSCGVWVGICHMNEEFPIIWPIKVLRVALLWSRTVLFIPIVSIVFQVLHCTDVWRGTVWKCFHSQHLTVTIFALILNCIYTLFIVVSSLCLIERDPRSGQSSSVVHGRVNGASLLITAVLCCAGVLGHTILSTRLLMAILALSAAGYTALHLMFLPYCHHIVNRVVCGLWTVYCWAVGITMMGILRNVPHVNVEPYVLLMCIPTSYYAGYVFADLRFRSFDQFNEKQPHQSPFSIELKARRMLKDVNLQATAHTVNSNQHAIDNEADDNEFKRCIEQCVEVYLSEAMERLPNSAWLHLFIGQYVHVYRQNRHVEGLHISAAEMQGAPADVAFLVQLRRAQIRQSDSSNGTGSMSVNSRLRFERFKARADEFTLKARQEQANFWHELNSEDPSLVTLDSIGKAFEDHCSKAEASFQELLRLNPASTITLRRYAVFLEEVANDPTKSARLLMQADEIDDALSKEHADIGSSVVMFAKGSTLDASREDVAVITIGQSTADLGIIQSANAPALKMFGYNRRDLVGLNIDVLVPQPLATVHQYFMLKYIESGRETVMNTTRTVFGRHKEGYIFPLLLNVKPLEHCFAGVIAELHTSEQFIIFTSEALLITAATAESCTLLQVKAADVNRSKVFMTSLMKELDLIHMLDETRTDCQAGVRKVSRRKKVNVPAPYSDCINTDGCESNTIAIWVRFQITRFSKDGMMIADAEGATQEEATTSSDERLVVMTWSHVEKDNTTPLDGSMYDNTMFDSGYDIAAALDEPCMPHHDSNKRGSGKCPFAGGQSHGVLPPVGHPPINATVVTTTTTDAPKRSSIKLSHPVSQQQSHSLAQAQANVVSQHRGEGDSDGTTERKHVRITRPQRSTSSASASTFASNSNNNNKGQSTGQSKLQLSALDTRPLLTNDPNRDKKIANNIAKSKVAPVDHEVSNQHTTHQDSGEKQSVASSQTSATAWSFHRAVQTGKAVEEKSLTLLRRVLLTVSATVGVLCIVAMLILQSSIVKDVNSVMIIGLEGQRASYTEKLMYTVSEMCVAAQGWNASTTLPTLQSQLTSDLATVTDVHNTLSYTYPPTSPQQKEFCYNTNFTMKRLHHVGVVSVQQSFVDMMAQYLAAAHRVNSLDASQLNINNSFVWFVLSNKDTVSTSLQQSQQLRYDWYNANEHMTRIPSLTVMVVAIGVLVLEIIAVVLPTVWRIDGEKFQIYSIFVTVPRAVIRMLHSQAQERFARMQMELENDRSSDEIEPEDQEAVYNFGEVDYAVKEHDRKLERTYLPSVKLALQISIPLLFFMAYFGGMQAYSASVSTQIQHEQYAVVLTEQRLASGVSAQLSLQLSLLTDNTTLAGGYVSSAVTATQSMLSCEEALYVGTINGFHTSITSSRDERTLTSENGCYMSTLPGCATVYNGLLKNGLHAAVLTYGDLLLQLSEKRLWQLNNGTDLTPQDRIDDADWQTIDELSVYIRDGLKQAAIIRQTTVHSMDDVEIRVSTIVGACFVVVVALSFVFLYLPMIRQLNAGLKRTRGMLLLFPSEVVMGVPAVKSMMQDYSKTRRM